MSLAKVKPIIENFITRDNSDALAINGNYGVGKTYFWQNLIKNFSEERRYSYQGITSGEGRDRKIGKPRYAYVSLFGIDNLESLKNALLSEIISSKEINNHLNQSSKVSKRIFTKLEAIPHFQKFTGGLLSSLVFQDEVRNALICFDDIDRKSDNLGITEILGLANLLKEHHNCKIALILNEDGFKIKSDSSDFREQVEKLVDFEINFAPEPNEIVEIVFSSLSKNNSLIKDFCRKLTIKNIRTLQKISRYLEELSPYLDNLEKAVVEDVIRSLILLVWCHYNKKDGAPTLEFVKDFGTVKYFSKKHSKEKLSEDEEIWANLVWNYGYQHTDEIDELLLAFVKNGFLDEKEFIERLQIKNQEIIQQEGKNKYHEAWRLYQNSFKHNETQFVEELYSGFLSNIKHLSIRELDETVSMLRNLESNEYSDSLIDKYLETRFDAESVRRLSLGDINFNVNDSYLHQRLNEKAASFEETRTIKEVLEKFGLNGTYHFEDIGFLSKLNEDDFYNYFKLLDSSNIDNQGEVKNSLYVQIKNCLNFIGGSEPYNTIAMNAKGAIIRIGLECRLNQQRVQNWFKISEEDIKEPRLKKKKKQNKTTPKV